MTVWYTARGAGLSALVLLTVTVCLGALASGRGRPATRYVTQYVHRATAGLGIGALVLHVATVIADQYAHVGVTGAIVPFTAGYRAAAVGLGTIAGYLVVLTTVIGLARSRFAATVRGARVWRALHVLGYAAWALGLVHGWTSGTDTQTPWVRFLYLTCAAAGVGALAWRYSVESRPSVLRRHSALREVQS
jgi:sulfoxide reductase heme-binding subunit YedZ